MVSAVRLPVEVVAMDGFTGFKTAAGEEGSSTLSVVGVFTPRS